MTSIELASLLGSLASLILAVVAIWLSVVFYRMTSELSEKARDSAKDIGAIVERLEKLFDLLYRDLFSMMRETVTDMRKALWSPGSDKGNELAKETEQRTAEKVEALKRGIDDELSGMLARQQIAEEQMEGLHEETRQLIDRAISESRQAEVEAQQETLRNQIIEVFRQPGSKAGDTLVLTLVRLSGVSPRSVWAELERMENEGLVTAPAGGSPASEWSATEKLWE